MSVPAACGACAAAVSKAALLGADGAFGPGAAQGIAQLSIDRSTKDQSQTKKQETQHGRYGPTRATR
ncbi:hypothetical protein [Falsiruegeria litorea]|uniref:hypothetical protein n=1 Tax=Falsiruegeria litorea TaxID=1280831 RepID=UPI0013FE3822|nr:hypothetical protein [Falsiruegeria litorea]